MSPDDPRHGTSAGHNAGCRLDCCRAAKLRYDKRRRWEALQGFTRLVPALGTRRRIRALQAIGHTFPAIGEAAGLSPKTIADLCYRSERVSTETARAIAEAYERLCMTPSPSKYALRGRKAAARKGWAPPLAWDDIDRDPEPAEVALVTGPADDEGVVERILAGDWRLKATHAQRLAVADRWVATGRPQNELERLTGWNVTRDRRLARQRQETAA